jgi:hypothetical protein
MQDVDKTMINTAALFLVLGFRVRLVFDGIIPTIVADFREQRNPESELPRLLIPLLPWDVRLRKDRLQILRYHDLLVKLIQILAESQVDVYPQLRSYHHNHLVVWKSLQGLEDQVQ